MFKIPVDSINSENIIKLIGKYCVIHLSKWYRTTYRNKTLLIFKQKKLIFSTDFYFQKYLNWSVGLTITFHYLLFILLSYFWANTHSNTECFQKKPMDLSFQSEPHIWFNLIKLKNMFLYILEHTIEIEHNKNNLLNDNRE